MVKKNQNYNRNVIYFLPILFAVLLGVAFSYFVLSGNEGFTGNVVLDLDADYQHGEIADGKLNILLKEGELIPASSKVVFESSGERYEYFLKDIINSEFVEGNFYLIGKSLSGNGSGYGIKGSREIYPMVNFQLVIFSEENVTSESQESEDIQFEENDIGEFQKNISDSQTEQEYSQSNEYIKLEEEVSAENPFIYELEEGQTAKIIFSSENVSLKIEGNQAVVITDYSEEEDGFGEEYIGDDAKEFFIDLSKMNLPFEEGDLHIGINYNGEEIVSLSSVLEEKGISKNETIELTEQDSVEVVVDETELVLTDDEENILSSNFGDFLLEVSDVMDVNGGVEVEFNFGPYSAVRFYDEDFSEEELKLQIEKDKINWLKDITESVS